MNYHLHRQEQNEGPFPLEELRRRKDAGGLTGAELVWCEGMATWQPLNEVLTPSSPHSPTAAGRRSRRKLAWVVGSVAVLVLLGLAAVVWVALELRSRVRETVPEASEDGGQSFAAKPIVWSTNTITQRDVQKRAHAFRTRQWLDGYRQYGDHAQPYDATAKRLIETWIDSNFGGPSATNPAAIQAMASQLADDPSFRDPLILTVTAVNVRYGPEQVRRLERALAGFDGSRYTTYPKWYAQVTLAGYLSGQRDRVATLDQAAVDSFRQAFADGSLRGDDQAEIADILLTDWGAGFCDRNSEAVCNIVTGAGKPFKWLALLLQGDREIGVAWKARGKDYAVKVSEAGWQGFAQHLDVARKCLTEAWELRPDLPHAATRMVTVAMGDSTGEEMREWFDRATAAQLDYPKAWSSMRWGLRPRWNGSAEAMLAFGIEALDTKRFDTDVPRQFFSTVLDLEAETRHAPGERLFGRADIWPHLQRMYEGYIAEPAQAATRDGWRSTYLAVAHLAGHNDVARQQLEALNWTPWARNLEDWHADLSLLPLEVAARTGTLSNEVGRAETRCENWEVAEALKIYEKLAADTGADTRTRDFIRHRLATLRLEAKLDQNEWVDFLPGTDEDPAWVFICGKSRRLPDGAVEVQAGPDGHLLFSHARIGCSFEVQGEFEVVRSSSREFQAGLVVGLPELNSSEWYAFRLRRNEAEGDRLSFSRGWTTQQIARPTALLDGVNRFHFRHQHEKVTASVNGQELLTDASRPRAIALPHPEYRLGLGAFNDRNDTVICYRNVKVRRVNVPNETRDGQTDR